MPSAHQIEVGRRLKETAKRRGLTSGAVGEALGVEDGTVRGWWRGYSEPSYEKLVAYADLVGSSVSYLLTGREDMGAVLVRLQAALTEFRAAVIAGEAPLAAWERILGRADVLTGAEREVLSVDPTGLRAYLTSVDGVEWVALDPEQHRLVRELVYLLGRYHEGARP